MSNLRARSDHPSNRAFPWAWLLVVASAGGAMLGGVVADGWGFAAVFILSGIGRLLAAILFAVFSRKGKAAVAASSG